MLITDDNFPEFPPVLGAMGEREALSALQEMGAFQEAITYDAVASRGSREAFEVREPARIFSRGPRPYEHTNHAFGYVAPPQPGDPDLLDLKSALAITPDEGLRNAALIVTLDYVRVADYPGSGIHHVLCNFSAEHHIPAQQVERLDFAQTFRAQEGESVGVVGFPIFVGVRAGTTGVAFKCYTVNVKNENDEGILAFLDSSTIQGGLRLLNTAQPALAPLTSMAVGITKMVAQRRRNLPVQSFFLGLDFSNVPTRAKLATGSYVAVQVPNAANWNWAEWKFSRSAGRVQNAADPDRLVPFNYLVFGVSRAEGDDGT